MLDEIETSPVTSINPNLVSNAQAYQELCQLTHQWWDKFNFQFRTNHPYPNISASLKITAAGRAIFKTNTINYNLALYKNNKETFAQTTIPHEIAHLFEFYFLLKKGIVFSRNDTFVILPAYKGKVLKHRNMWKTIMRSMGLNQSSRHSYSLKAIHPYVYKCSCREHPISKIIHSKILRGNPYRCKHCRSSIIFAYKTEV